MLILKKRATTEGFTIVELLIVVVVIAILAAITIVSYTGIQARAKTSSSLSTANEVQQKAIIWHSLQSSYPDLAQLRTNSLSPTTIDAPGGAAGPAEAKLSSPDAAIGADLDDVRANNGKTVYYAPCWDGTKHSGARIIYRDYTAAEPQVTIIIGSCP